MRRREFIAGFGAVAWPLRASAQQPALPVVGFITTGSLEGYGRYLPAYRAGLGESDYIEGRNVAIEYFRMRTERLEGRCREGSDTGDHDRAPDDWPHASSN